MSSFFAIYFLVLLETVLAASCSKTLVEQLPIGYIEKGAGNFKSIGATSAVIVDPSNEQVIHLATVSGGIWKSTDGGQNWRWMTSQLPSQTIGSIVFDWADTSYQTIYASVTSLSSASYLKGESYLGLYVSKDGGETYSIIGTGAFGITTIADLEVRGNKLLACTQKPSAIFSSDPDKDALAPDSERKKSKKTDETNVKQEKPTETYGLYGSYDGGNTWQEIHLGAEGCGNIVADVSNPNKVWFTMMGEEYVYSVMMSATKMTATPYTEKIPKQCLVGTSRTKIGAGKGSIFVAFGVSTGGTEAGAFRSAEELEREENEEHKKKGVQGTEKTQDDIQVTEKYPEKLSCLLMSKTGMNGDNKWVQLDTEFSDRVHPVYEPILIGQSDPHLGFAAVSTLSDVVFIGNTYQELNGVSGSEISWSSRITMCDARQPKGKQCIPVTDRFAQMTNGHPDSRFLLFWNSGDRSYLYDCNDGGLNVLHDPLTNQRKWEALINYPISEVNQGGYDPDNDVWLVAAQDNGLFRTTPGVYDYAELHATGDGSFVVPSRDKDGQIYFFTATQYAGYSNVAWYNASTANWTTIYLYYQYPLSIPFFAHSLFHVSSGSIIVGSFGGVVETTDFNRRFHLLFWEAGITTPAIGPVIQLRERPWLTTTARIPFYALTSDGFVLTRTAAGKLGFFDLNLSLSRLNAQALSICVPPTDLNVFYIVTRRYILEFGPKGMTIVGDFKDFFPYPTFQQVRDCQMIYSQKKEMHYMVAATSAGVFLARAMSSDPNVTRWDFELISKDVTYYSRFDYDPVADHLSISSYGSGMFYIKEASAKFDCYYYGETKTTMGDSSISSAISNFPNYLILALAILFYQFFF